MVMINDWLELRRLAGAARKQENGQTSVVMTEIVAIGVFVGLTANQREIRSRRWEIH